MHDPLHPQEHPNFTRPATEVDLQQLLSTQTHCYLSISVKPATNGNDQQSWSRRLEQV
jgi:hypothetical protein